MSNFRLKVETPYPGQIIGSQGIDVGKDWVVTFNDQEFPLVSPYTPTTTDYALVFDTKLNYYFLVPTSNLL